MSELREEIARKFHDTYERLAPSFGYETRADTKAFDPESPNGRLMMAVCAEVRDYILSLALPALGVEGWRPEVRAFADLMEAKLRENDHKAGWKGEDASDLFPRIAEEADELWRAMVRHSKRLSWGDAWVMETDTVERIGREAADVANFAMMIADVCGALPPPPVQGDET